MSNLRDDPLMDACLEEVLGNRQPPDLTARILRALEQRRRAESRLPPTASVVPSTNATSEAPPAVEDPLMDACLDEVLGGQTPPHVSPAIISALASRKTDVPAGDPMAPVPTASALQPAKPTSATYRRRRNTHEVQGALMSIAVAVAIMLIGGAIVVSVWDSPQNMPDTARHETPLPNPGLRPQPDTSPAPTESPARDVTVSDEPLDTMPPETLVPDASPSPEVVQAPPTEGGQLSLDSLDEPERPTPLPPADIVAAINEQIEAAWAEYEVAPSPAADDEQWIRRVYVKLVGREPDDEELSAFVTSNSEDKRESVVDTLLSSDDLKPELVRHWSEFWATTLLVGRGDEVAHRGLQRFLRQSLADGQGFDQVTHELLTATGNGSPGSDDFNGAANFLLVHRDADAVAATVHTSRVFLATSVQCAQCHAHSTNNQVTQASFWELNAFFRQLNWRPDSDGRLTLVDQDFTGQGDAEIYYSQPDGVLRVAYPTFAGYDNIPRSGIVDRVNRREWLAKAVTRSDRFAQATVNRVWAQLLGHGFTTPVDDIGEHNPPSHPQLLSDLADQFVAYDYDIRKLIQWIALSEPFARSSAVSEQNATSWFAAYLNEQSSPRPSLAASLQTTAKMLASAPEATQGTAARLNSTQPNPNGILRLTPDESISLNVLAADSLTNGRSLGQRILDSDLVLQQKVEHIFFALLHRGPTAGEQQQVNRMLANENRTEVEVLEHLWRALSGSQEAHWR